MAASLLGLSAVTPSLGTQPLIGETTTYSEVQLEIGDPSIADLRVTTTFYSDRVSSWLTGIEMALPVKVARPNEASALILPAA